MFHRIIRGDYLSIRIDVEQVFKSQEKDRAKKIKGLILAQIKRKRQ